MKVLRGLRVLYQVFERFEPFLSVPNSGFPKLVVLEFEKPQFEPQTEGTTTETRKTILFPFLGMFVEKNVWKLYQLGSRPIQLPDLREFGL